MTFQIACIQNCASADMDASLDEASELTHQARQAGADLICLPEFFSCLSVSDQQFEVGAHPERVHPALTRFSAIARELEAWIQLGSLAIRCESGKIRNRCLMLDPQGQVTARYDKIHLFDVDLSKDEGYRESDTVEAGDSAVLAPTPWGLLGLSVCYDLRFPHLYRVLAQSGACVLTVPAAFTKVTGEAHWHVLLRARAIECGCYVVAACQYGSHGKARTYGHSLIVDPWGVVLADGGDNAGFIMAEIDPDKADQARQRIPALRHDRRFGGPLPATVEGAA